MRTGQSLKVSDHDVIDFMTVIILRSVHVDFNIAPTTNGHTPIGSVSGGADYLERLLSYKLTSR